MWLPSPSSFIEIQSRNQLEAKLYACPSEGRVRINPTNSPGSTPAHNYIYSCSIKHSLFYPSVMIGTLLAIGGHAMLAFFGFSQSLPIVAMVLRAVAYAVIGCALWPLIAYLVEDSQLGTAYGL